MTKKILSIVLFLSLLVIIAGFFLRMNDDPNAYIFWSWGGTIFFFCGIVLLAKEGTFLGSTESRLARPGIAGVLTGVLFKIMHWPSAGIIISAGLAWILVVYLIHFFKKKSKQLADLGKLVFVASFLTGRFLTIMHFPKGYEVSFFSLMILVLLVISSLRNQVAGETEKKGLSRS